MKRLLPAVVLLLGLAVPAFGQDTIAEAPYVVPFKKTISLEIGTGYAPIHNLALGNGVIRTQLAPSGQFASDGYPLSFTMVGVLRTGKFWEMKLTTDFTWQNCGVKQFDTFGVDPYGQPRYKMDYENAEYIGRRNMNFSWSATLTMRRIYNPFRNFQTYTEFGLGVVVFQGRAAILPSITPIGARYCWEHFYLFAEFPFTPYATLLHGGLGWKF